MSEPLKPPMPFFPTDKQIEKFPVQTYQTQIPCPQLLCEGKLNFTGQAAADSPMAQFLHVCTECGEARLMMERYPSITTERITDEPASPATSE